MDVGTLTPVLWLNVNDGRIFNFPVQAQEKTRESVQEIPLASDVTKSRVSLSRANFRRQSRIVHNSTSTQYPTQLQPKKACSAPKTNYNPIQAHIDPKHRDTTKDNTYASQAHINRSLVRKQVEETREWLKQRDISSMADASPQRRHYLQICAQYTKELYDLFHQLGHIEQDQTEQMYQRYSNKAHEILELRKKIESLDAVLQKQNALEDNL